MCGLLAKAIGGFKAVVEAKRAEWWRQSKDYWNWVLYDRPVAHGGKPQPHHPDHSWQEILRLRAIIERLERRLREMQAQREIERAKKRDQRPRPHSGGPRPLLQAARASLPFVATAIGTLAFSRACGAFRDSVTSIARSIARGASAAESSLGSVAKLVETLRSRLATVFSRAGIPWGRLVAGVVGLLVLKVVTDAGVVLVHGVLMHLLRIATRDRWFIDAQH
jgi:hypothetical protein